MDLASLDHLRGSWRGHHNHHRAYEGTSLWELLGESKLMISRVGVS